MKFKTDEDNVPRTLIDLSVKASVSDIAIVLLNYWSEEWSIFIEAPCEKLFEKFIISKMSSISKSAIHNIVANSVFNHGRFYTSYFWKGKYNEEDFKFFIDYLADFFNKN